MSSLKLCGGAKSLKLSHQLCNGELSLTEEEKRTLVSEGIPYSIFWYFGISSYSYSVFSIKGIVYPNILLNLTNILSNTMVFTV